MENKILLTGAGGRLGSYLREPLSEICRTLISTDIKENIGNPSSLIRYPCFELQDLSRSIQNDKLTIYHRSKVKNSFLKFILIGGDFFIMEE